VSNATRWDTFEAMMGEAQLPPSEAAFRQRYQKSPSFLSIHMGVRAELLPEVRQCWAICLADESIDSLTWERPWQI
jgi:prolycopene isomerase